MYALPMFETVPGRLGRRIEWFCLVVGGLSHRLDLGRGVSIATSQLVVALPLFFTTRGDDTLCSIYSSSQALYRNLL